MIYAITINKYPQCLGFDTKFQDRVENAMNAMGYGSSQYYLSSTKSLYPYSKIKLLDKYGYYFTVNNL
jgi:hypothetical protein